MIPDTNDFRETFHKFYPSVCRQLTFLLGDATAAQDMAQETFLRLYERPPATCENLGGWLNRVAANLAYNYLRAAKRREQREVGQVTESLSTAVSLDEVVIKNLEVQMVRRVLNHMTPRDRVCLLLKHSGSSYAEIATAVGVPVNSVGTIVARAQKHFRQIYELRE